MSFQNSTLPSPVTRHGASYWASFTEKSFCRGQRFKVYSGVVNGLGEWRGAKCVVKVFKDTPGTKALCTYEVKKSAAARELSEAFNRACAPRRSRITTTRIFWAPMDEVSVLKKIFFTGRRRLTTEEIVLFEDDLRDDDLRPGRDRKLTVYVDTRGRQVMCKAKDMEAFCHFSYHHSEGRLVLCGLEGVHDSEGFVIKTPTIHSRGKEFGSCDRGEAGILQVFDHHICSEICRDFIKPPRNVDTTEDTRLEIDSCEDNVREEPNALTRHLSDASHITIPTAPLMDENEQEIFLSQTVGVSPWFSQGDNSKLFRHRLPSAPSIHTDWPLSKSDFTSSPDFEQVIQMEDYKNSNSPLNPPNVNNSSSCDELLPTENANTPGFELFDYTPNWVGGQVRFSLSGDSLSNIDNRETNSSIDNNNGSGVSPTNTEGNIHGVGGNVNIQHQTAKPTLQITASCQSALSQLMFFQSPPPRLPPPGLSLPGSSTPAYRPTLAMSSSSPACLDRPPSYLDSQVAHCYSWVQENLGHMSTSGVKENIDHELQENKGHKTTSTFQENKGHTTTSRFQENNGHITPSSRQENKGHMTRSTLQEHPGDKTTDGLRDSDTDNGNHLVQQ